MNRPIINALTGLRFAGAAHVMAFHLGLDRLDGMPTLVGRFIERGEVAVSLFFVLSGFVLTYRYSGRDLTGEARRTFLVARVARVWPLYLLGLVVSLPDFVRDSADQWLAVLAAGLLTVVGLQAWLPQTTLAWNFPSWSLSNEAFFYGLFPRLLAAVEALRSRTIWHSIVAAWVVSQVPQLVYRSMDSTGPLLHNFVTYFPLFRFPEFFIGIATGTLFLRNRDAITPNRGPAYSLIGVAVSASVAAGLSGLPELITRSESFLSPAFALLTYGVALGGGPTAWLLERNWIVVLGNASYAMYILHVPIARSAQRFAYNIGLVEAPSRPGFLAAILAAVLVVSIPVHLLFERPARRWVVERYRRHMQSPSPA